MDKLIVLVNNAKGMGQHQMTSRLKYYLEEKGYRVKEICEEDNWQVITNKIGKKRILGIILSGSDIRITKKTNLKMYKNSITALIKYPNVPVLGICFGMQIMSVVYGSNLSSLVKPIIGIKKVHTKKGVLFQKSVRGYRVYENHYDMVNYSPVGFKTTAINSCGYIEAIENVAALRFGVQFHPEYHPTRFGCKVIDNFIKFCHNMSS